MGNNGMPGHPEGCKCGMCQGHGMHGCMCGGHHYGSHLLIKILVALFIFWVGVQFGELKATIHPEYSTFRMMNWSAGNDQGINATYGWSPMMQGAYWSATSTDAK